MAKKNMDKLRDMTPEQLGKEEDGLREEIWKLRLQVATGQIQSPHQVRQVKRDLARVLTVKREQDLTADKSKKA